MQQVRRQQAMAAAPIAERAPVSPPPSPRIQRPAARPIATVTPIARDRSLVSARPGALVPVRRRGGTLVTLGNLWVLHRRTALRVLALLVALVLAISAYLMREDLSEATGFAVNVVTGQMAEAGFGVEQIEISGVALTREADIARALGIEPGMTSFGLDIEAARLRVEEIPSVETATIRKIYPDSLQVTITEKEPVARWRIDGLTMLIDSTGSPIAPARAENGDLTLVIGESAGDDALPMINLMQRYPDLTFDLAALSRIADRRWDLIFYSGLRVQLPETGVVEALNRLNEYHLEYRLLERDVDLVDMRVPQYVAVRPTKREEESES